MAFLKLSLLAAALITTQQLHASVTSFAVENLSLDFAQYRGQAHVGSFAMGFEVGQLDLRGYDIDIIKGQGNFVFSKEDTRFRLDGIDESVLDGVSALSAKRIDAKGVGNKSLEFQFEDGTISLGEEVHGVSSISLNCHSEARGSDTLISFLLPCFDQGELSIPELRLAKKNATVLQELWQTEKGLLSAPKKIEDIKLRIIKEQMELSLKARFVFRFTFSAKGTAKMGPDRDEAIFDIQEAKVGFINVHGLVLKLLARIDVPNVTVEGSKITVKF